MKYKKEHIDPIYKGILNDIYQSCNTAFGFDIATRNREVYPFVLARAVYYKISKDIMPKVACASIGAIIDRDHSTVLHNLKKIDWVFKNDEAFMDMYSSALDVFNSNAEYKKPDELKVESPKIYELKREIVYLQRTIKTLEDKLTKVDSHKNFEQHEIKYRELPELKKKIYRERVNAILKMI